MFENEDLNHQVSDMLAEFERIFPDMVDFQRIAQEGRISPTPWRIRLSPEGRWDVVDDDGRSVFGSPANILHLVECVNAIGER